MRISLDFESRGAVDITKCGAYAYIDDPSFSPLLLSYAITADYSDDIITDEDVQTIDFINDPDAWDKFRYIYNNYIRDSGCMKTAYNVGFERTIFRKYFENVPVASWEDTAVIAAYNGLPRKLADVCRILPLDEDLQKLDTGNSLITFFCKPYKGSFRDPKKYPDRWAEFIRYNRRDVVAEQAVSRWLSTSPWPESERKLWWLDQKINDLGVRIDIKMVNQAIKMAETERETLTQEAKDITHLDNPNSVMQLKDWLELEESATLRKADVSAMLETVTDADKARVLAIRQELSRSSVKKYDAMLRAVCTDGRVHGALQFYGANRTGRWAGRIIQPQNYPQNHMSDKDLDTARQLVKKGDMEALQLFYGSINDTLSQLTRTALIPAEGKTFCVADFSAIEARVLAWVADEKWRMQAFADGKDIYCASASQMFGVPVEKHGINGELRQKGKIAELALGYGGSVGAMVAMGADKMGLQESELQDIVSKWRASSPKIVQLWKDVGDTALYLIKGYGRNDRVNGIMFSMTTVAGIRALVIRLPSGRRLTYLDPKIGTNRFGGESITYMGYEEGRWSRIDTFGGKLVENIIQAIARDCLAVTMQRVDKAGMPIVFTVHDEMIVESLDENAEESLDKMLACMAKPIDWAYGLVLKGAGYVTPYYKKD